MLSADHFLCFSVCLVDFGEPALWVTLFGKMGVLRRLCAVLLSHYTYEDGQSASALCGSSLSLHLNL